MVELGAADGPQAIILAYDFTDFSYIFVIFLLVKQQYFLVFVDF